MRPRRRNIFRHARSSSRRYTTASNAWDTAASVGSFALGQQPLYYYIHYCPDHAAPGPGAEHLFYYTPINGGNSPGTNPTQGATTGPTATPTLTPTNTPNATATAQGHCRYHRDRPCAGDRFRYRAFDRDRRGAGQCYCWCDPDRDLRHAYLPGCSERSHECGHHSRQMGWHRWQ